MNKQERLNKAVERMEGTPPFIIIQGECKPWWNGEAKSDDFGTDATPDIIFKLYFFYSRQRVIMEDYLEQVSWASALVGDYENGSYFYRLYVEEREHADDFLRELNARC